MKRFLAFGILLLATGCTTTQEDRPRQADTDRAAQCVMAVKNSKDFDVLRARIPVDSKMPTPAQLADKRKANAAEVAALKVITPRIQQCQGAYVNAIRSYAPKVADTMQASFAKNDDWRAMVANREITWSQYSAAMRDLATSTEPLTSPVKK